MSKGSAAGAAPFAPSAEALLELVRGEATKFGRCCDLYQDGLGTFADHECQQRTFAMLRDVQQVLGVDKAGGPLPEVNVVAARARARLNNAAPTMLATLKVVGACIAERAVNDDELWGAYSQVIDAIAKAEQ